MQFKVQIQSGLIQDISILHFPLLVITGCNKKHAFDVTNSYRLIGLSIYWTERLILQKYTYITYYYRKTVGVDHGNWDCLSLYLYPLLCIPPNPFPGIQCSCNNCTVVLWIWGFIGINGTCLPRITSYKTSLNKCTKLGQPLPEEYT